MSNVKHCQKSWSNLSWTCGSSDDSKYSRHTYCIYQKQISKFLCFRHHVRRVIIFLLLVNGCFHIYHVAFYKTLEKLLPPLFLPSQGRVPCATAASRCPGASTAGASTRPSGATARGVKTERSSGPGRTATAVSAEGPNQYR